MTLVLGEGKLYVDPTDLGAAAPYGGTELATFQDAEIVIDRVIYEVTGEEFGGDVIDTVIQRSSAWIKLTFQGWESAAVATWFLNTTDNGDSVDTVTMPEGQEQGNDHRVKLLFVPTRSDEPAWLVYAAIPDTMSEPVRSSSLQPMELRVRFRMALDDNGKKIAIDKFSRLSLT